MLKRIEIQNAPDSDTYRALYVYDNGGEKWDSGDYGTIEEAAASNIIYNVPIYDCTGRKTPIKRNRIDTNTL